MNKSLQKAQEKRARKGAARLASNDYGLAVESPSAIHNKSNVAESVKVAFGNACRMSMVAFKQGHGSDIQWHTLVKCLNVAMVLSERGVMPEGLSAINGGLDALVIVHNIGTWQLGSHAFAINSAINIFLRQLEVATNRQVSDAEKEVIKRVEQIPRG